MGVSRRPVERRALGCGGEFGFVPRIPSSVRFGKQTSTGVNWCKRLSTDPRPAYATAHHVPRCFELMDKAPMPCDGSVSHVLRRPAIGNPPSTDVNWRKPESTITASNGARQKGTKP